jgi:hypothetical protein
LDEQAAAEEEVRAAAVLRHLAARPGWLLILDNVDTPEAAATVQGLLPDLQGGRVLITSRRSEWSGGVATVELDVLEEEAAVAFLLERTDGRRRATPSDEADDGREQRAGDGQCCGASIVTISLTVCSRRRGTWLTESKRRRGWSVPCR